MTDEQISMRTLHVYPKKGNLHFHILNILTSENQNFELKQQHLDL